MLKYVLVFCLISSLTNGYNKLVLIQRSPAAVIFEQEYNWGNEGVAANKNAIKALREIGRSFEARKWIIEKLWATAYRSPLQYCDDIFDEVTRDYDQNLDSAFQTDLAKIWPNLDEKITDNDLWIENYDIYGCCIHRTALGYFQLAMRLMHNNNVGEILTQSGIHPGGTYELNRIFDSIRNFTDTRPYVICLPDENRGSDEQYLLEVHICFNKDLAFIHCDTVATKHCDPTKIVFYPGSRRA